MNRVQCTRAGASGRLHWLRWDWLRTAATAWHTRAGTPHRPHAGQWCPQVPGPLERPALGDAADIRWNPGQRWCAVAWSALVRTSVTTVLKKEQSCEIIWRFRYINTTVSLKLYFIFNQEIMNRPGQFEDLRHFSLVCVDGIQWAGKICFYGAFLTSI